MFEFKRKATYFGSLRGALILEVLGMPKRVPLLMNRYRMFFVQVSTPPPSMHQKLTEHGRCCIHNKQLLTKTYVALENNSNVQHLKTLRLFVLCDRALLTFYSQQTQLALRWLSFYSQATHTSAAPTHVQTRARSALKLGWQ